jgi:hypothetical protein
MKLKIEGLHLWAISISYTVDKSQRFATLWIVTRRNVIQTATSKAVRFIAKSDEFSGALILSATYRGTIDA